MSNFKYRLITELVPDGSTNAATAAKPGLFGFTVNPLLKNVTVSLLK